MDTDSKRAQLSGLRDTLDSHASLLEEHKNDSYFSVDTDTWEAVESTFDLIRIHVPKLKKISFNCKLHTVLQCIKSARGAITHELSALSPSPLPHAPDEISHVRRRQPGTVSSHVAAKRLSEHMDSKGIRQTRFAIAANTTDRTIRSFLKTGKVRKDIFESIANAMGISHDELLKPE